MEKLIRFEDGKYFYVGNKRYDKLPWYFTISTMLASAIICTFCIGIMYLTLFVFGHYGN